MKLIKGREYNGLTFVGIHNISFICELCGKRRERVYEFCTNWADYQQGVVAGEWVHYGSECVRKFIGNKLEHKP